MIITNLILSTIGILLINYTTPESLLINIIHLSLSLMAFGPVLVKISSNWKQKEKFLLDNLLHSRIRMPLYTISVILLSLFSFLISGDLLTKMFLIVLTGSSLTLVVLYTSVINKPIYLAIWVYYTIFLLSATVCYGVFVASAT